MMVLIIMTEYIGQCLPLLAQPLSSSPRGTRDKKWAIRFVYHYGGRETTSLSEGGSKNKRTRGDGLSIIYVQNHLLE